MRVSFTFEQLFNLYSSVLGNISFGAKILELHWIFEHLFVLSKKWTYRLFVRFSRCKIVISLFTVTKLSNIVDTPAMQFSSLSKTYLNNDVRAIAVMMCSHAQVPSRHIYGGNLRPPLWNKPQKLKWRMLHRLMYQNSRQGNWGIAVFLNLPWVRATYRSFWSSLTTSNNISNKKDDKFWARQNDLKMFFRLVSFLLSYEAFDIAYLCCMLDACQPRFL